MVVILSGAGRRTGILVRATDVRQTPQSRGNDGLSARRVAAVPANEAGPGHLRSRHPTQPLTRRHGLAYPLQQRAVMTVDRGGKTVGES